MWTAQALMQSGESAELKILQIGGRHSPIREILPLARDLASSVGVKAPWHLLETAIDSGPSPWSDPISVWAAEMTQSSSFGIAFRRLRTPGGDVGIDWEEGGVQVWQVPTVVVVPVPNGAAQLSIDYEWDRDVPFPRLFEPHVREFEPHVRGEVELFPTFDGRLYMGNESSILEADEHPAGWNLREMLLDRQPRFRWLFGVKNRAGVLIGRLARRLVRRPQRIISDPGFSARLTAEEARDPRTSATCPRIEHMRSSHKSIPMVVVVHGTFSCAMEAAERVRAACPELAVARFEHDTFRPVSENVGALVDHLTRLRNGNQAEILLLAHSRGGLVASQAAAILGAQSDPRNLTVWTAGTPHFGTPIAGVGGLPARAIGALYRLCARSEQGGLRATVVEGAVSYLIAAGELPAGVACMRLGSDLLDLHRLHVRRLHLRTWGGRCDPAAVLAGHSLLLPPAVAEVFDHEDHDLVVPTESAILDGSAALENCTHFQYLDRCGLREELTRHFGIH
jgi:hypothetical protein